MYSVVIRTLGVLDYANCMFAYHNASDNYEQPDNEKN